MVDLLKYITIMLKIQWKTKKWWALKNFYEKSTQLWRAIFHTPGGLDCSKSKVEINIMSLMHVPNFIEIGLLVNKWPNYFHKFCDLSHCAVLQKVPILEINDIFWKAISRKLFGFSIILKQNQSTFKTFWESFFFQKKPLTFT